MWGNILLYYELAVCTLHWCLKIIIFGGMSYNPDTYRYQRGMRMYYFKRISTDIHLIQSDIRTVAYPGILFVALGGGGGGFGEKKFAGVKGARKRGP